MEFWDLTWSDDRRYLPQETRLLLSMVNALGAGRMRQASREPTKVCALGCDSAALDDMLELIAWNQGIGTFAGEVVLPRSSAPTAPSRSCSRGRAGRIKVRFLRLLLEWAGADVLP